MDKLEKLAFLALTIGCIVTIILVMIVLAQFLVSNNISISSDWTLSIVTAATTSVLVVITALQMREARKVRLESVRPSLSLEPSAYAYGGGFLDLMLANSGMTAQNVDIDVKYKEKTYLLYISSIASTQRVPILSGSFPSDGGLVTVKVGFRDLYGMFHEEILSIDFDTINLNKRRFAYVTSPLDAVAGKIEDMVRSIKRLD